MAYLTREAGSGFLSMIGRPSGQTALKALRLQRLMGDAKSLEDLERTSR
jgi:hypothetical protein